MAWKHALLAIVSRKPIGALEVPAARLAFAPRGLLAQGPQPLFRLQRRVDEALTHSENAAIECRYGRIEPLGVFLLKFSDQGSPGILFESGNCADESAWYVPAATTLPLRPPHRAVCARHPANWERNPED